MIISICGDVCSECPRYQATQSNSEEELEKVAKQWFQLGLRDHIVDTKEIKCNGCNKQKPCSYNLNSCENLEGINNCGECNLFPCKKIESAFEKLNRGDEYYKARLDVNEYAQLKKAFFMKKEILTEIQNRKFQK